MALPTSGPEGQAVFWIGSNGHLYYKNAASGWRVVEDTSPHASTPEGVQDLANMYNSSGAWTQIADPNAPAATTTRTTTGTTAPARVVNGAAVSATQQAIDSLGLEQNTGYKNIDDSYSSLISKYGRENEKAEGDYGQSSVTNNQNLLKNKQNALVAAAQGRRGLRSTLAALGALAGTGSELADRVVTQGANEDIGGAAETFAGNQGTLDKAIGNYREEDADRRREAETAKANQRTALEGSIANKRQQFYQKMAELFAEGDDNANAATWLGRAGDLNNEIASKTRVAATPFTERSAAFTPGELADYLAGAGDMTVGVAEGDQAGTGINPNSIFAGRKRKRQEEAALV